MPDTETALIIAAGGVAARDSLTRMLGPTADLIGSGLRDGTHWTAANVRRVLAKAAGRFSEEELSNGDAVPPRVLGPVLQAAQLTDDELISAYLAGVLASSRSEGGDDDRSAALAHVVDGLSTYAVRAHYALYGCARQLSVGMDWMQFTATAAKPRLDLTAVVSRDAVMQSMQFRDGTDLMEKYGVLTDTWLAFNRNRIFSKWSVLEGSIYRAEYEDAPRNIPNEVSVYFNVTQFGVLLYLAAHGVRHNYHEAWVDPSRTFVLDEGPSIPRGVWLRDLD